MLSPPELISIQSVGNAHVQNLIISEVHHKASNKCSAKLKLMYVTFVVIYKYPGLAFIKPDQLELEQLERLHSEDTHRRLMITHSIESYWIPSQKKTKSKLQI